MAFQPSLPGQAQADLENWYVLAMQQRAENPLPVDAVGAESPFVSRLGQALPQNYAQTSSGTVMDFGQSAPQSPDVWQSGGNVLRRQQQPDGTFLVTKRVPTYDSEGRQSSAVVQEVEVPDHLNPAKLKELAYRKLQQELQAKPMEPKLVDGQWVMPPSADRPGGIAYPVEGFQRRAGDKQVDKQVAQDRVSELLGNLQENYETLRKGGATVDTKQNWLQNLKARTGSSAVGQMVGGAIGSPEQEIRDKIQMAKPLLINEIRAATGMSAKAMDSNAELQFYLQAATDPTRNIEANLQAIKYLDSAYGGGRLSARVGLPGQGTSTVAPSVPPQMPSGPASQQIRDNGAYIEADGKRYIVIRRNPDGSAVIRDPQTGRTGTMRQ